MGLKFECSNLNFNYSNFNILISFVFDVVIKKVFSIWTLVVFPMWDLLFCEKTSSLSQIGKIEENDTLFPL